jgi:hypothetical protein
MSSTVPGDRYQCLQFYPTIDKTETAELESFNYSGRGRVAIARTELRYTAFVYSRSWVYNHDSGFWAEA